MPFLQFSNRILRAGAGADHGGVSGCAGGGLALSLQPPPVRRLLRDHNTGSGKTLWIVRIPENLSFDAKLSGRPGRFLTTTPFLEQERERERERAARAGRGGRRVRERERRGSESERERERGRDQR